MPFRCDTLTPGTVLVDERPRVAGSRTGVVVSVGDDTITLQWDDRDVLWPLPLPVGVRRAWPWEL
jgi:hypothetical protein